MRKRAARKNKPSYCGRSRTAKIRYRTLKDAKSARAGMLARFPDSEPRIYRCPECEGYHLTKEREYTYGDTRTVWKSPYGTVSSRYEPFLSEEDPDE